eukprot:CCRYP_006975-RA/>CCRYP_006975-RA protein AED:0.31 eAED:0.31 QI:0/-1/0/1/-1/0/1/0/163
MIDPATSWFEILELPVTEFNSVTPTGKKGCKGTNTHNNPKETYFDKSSAQVGSFVNKIWFSHYPRCQVTIYNNGSKFKLNFETLCDSHSIKCKPTSIKNPQANAILEQMHQVITTMLRTAELDFANTVVQTSSRMLHGPFAPHIPHSTQSLSRSSNIWQGHAV